MKNSFDDTRSYYRSYRQTEEGQQTPAQWFVEELKNIAAELDGVYKNPKPMILTELDRYDFHHAKNCSICGKAFKKNEKKVRDHDHNTGRYRGAAHNKCNLNYQNSRYIPVVFHNLTGYDAHFIIKELASNEIIKGRLTVIAENKDRYISFTKNIEGSAINFRFIDSFRFMASSLEKLASYLPEKEISTSTLLEAGFTQEQIKLLTKKGVYPYDYTSSFEKLEETNLPSKEDFYSKLLESDISEEDYKHAEAVWDKLNVRTLGQYSEIYMMVDILLLSDVFETFRSTCMEAYKLDPAHYYTTPSLSWDAMLKNTHVELELVTDIDMLLFIERGIRDGISQCSDRYAEANSPYMETGYDPQQEEKYLIYWDSNNLYGWAMSQYLPYGGLKWVEDLNDPDFYVVPEDSSVGYILEVDLEIDPELHDKFRDLPFCAEHMVPPNSKQKKLLTTLHNKERYVIHYRALIQAREHGVKVKKIHRALQFDQSAWLQPYVEFNTKKRTAAKNEFEKNFFKLMINAIFGKTMENERKRIDAKVVNVWNGRYGAEACIARPDFHSLAIIANDTVIIEMNRTEITIKKPMYIGLSILDISKTLMYDFHYSKMMSWVGPKKCKLLYMDTDSFIYEIRGTDVYELMREHSESFDTSAYPADNRFGIEPKNKKVIENSKMSVTQKF